MMPNIEWTTQEHDTAYLFYQGVTTSQATAVRYLGGKKLGTTTQETAESVLPGIEILPRERLWVYPELDEINRTPRISILSRIRQWSGSVKVKRPSATLDYVPFYPQDEQGSVGDYTLKNQASSMGQVTDIANHKKRYDTLMDPTVRNGKEPKRVDNVVLFGASRGAATTFSALATHKIAYNNVKLCVLEAPPATVSAVFKFYFTKLFGKLLYNKFIAYWFLGHQHQTAKDKQAMGYVEVFPQHIPLVVITSQNDKIVPHKSSLNLAMRVAASRIEAMSRVNDSPEALQVIAPVYFLQLDQAGHNVAVGAEKDRLRYQNFLHAVYRQHGLPFIEAYANKGEHELSVAELTRGKLKTQVMFQHDYKQHKEKAVRVEIRKNAFNVLKSDVESESAPSARSRMIKVCNRMSLYAKYPHGFFGKTTHTQRALEKLEPTSCVSVL